MKNNSTTVVVVNNNNEVARKGHSIILHLLFGSLLLYIPTIYYTFSRKHYWHL